jgi:hypothetical protein
MGKRGPAPSGEYSDKTQVLSTRISAGLRANLATAAKSSGHTLSREIEHRLRRTFSDDAKISDAFGDRRNYALMKMISSVVEAVVNRKILSAVTAKQLKKLHWLDDPYAFDQAIRAIAAVLDAIRPPGEIPQSLDEVLDQYGGTFQGKFNAIETLRDIQTASDQLPLPSTKGTRHQHKMSALKSDIGDLADRAQIRGRSANDTRKFSELGRKFGALRRKQAKTPEAITSEDVRQMTVLVDEIARYEKPAEDQRVKGRARK